MGKTVSLRGGGLLSPACQTVFSDGVSPLRLPALLLSACSCSVLILGGFAWMEVGSVGLGLGGALGFRVWWVAWVRPAWVQSPLGFLYSFLFLFIPGAPSLRSGGLLCRHQRCLQTASSLLPLWSLCFLHKGRFSLESPESDIVICLVADLVSLLGSTIFKIQIGFSPFCNRGLEVDLGIVWVVLVLGQVCFASATSDRFLLLPASPAPSGRRFPALAGVCSSSVCSSSWQLFFPHPASELLLRTSPLCLRTPICWCSGLGLWSSTGFLGWILLVTVGLCWMDPNVGNLGKLLLLTSGNFVLVFCSYTPSAGSGVVLISCVVLIWLFCSSLACFSLVLGCGFVVLVPSKFGRLVFAPLVLFNGLLIVVVSNFLKATTINNLLISRVVYQILPSFAPCLVSCFLFLVILFDLSLPVLAMVVSHLKRQSIWLVTGSRGFHL